MIFLRLSSGIKACIRFVRHRLLPLDALAPFSVKCIKYHHEVWNSVRDAKHSKKENLKTFPGATPELCQKSPVILETDISKEGCAEHKLPLA